jgi:ferric-dicitrate binding protein FerR (iron transport regulator)
MNDEPRDAGLDEATTRGGDDEAMVAQLLGAAGRRPPLPAAELAEVRAMVRQAWQERSTAAAPAGPARPVAPAAHPRWGGRRAIALATALAAGLVLVVGLVWWRSTRPVPPAAMVAVVELVKGDVQMGGPDAPWRPLVAGAAVPAGAELRSATVGGRGFASLRLAGGGNLRLDAGTRLRLLAADELALDEGAVYLDSGPRPAANALVHTPLGDVRELGTQFTVRLAAGGRELRVRVREGAVAASSGGRRHTAHAGEELVVDRQGHAAVHAAPSSGEGWAWILAAAPPFAAEGRTVAELLEWVSRETGWRLRYEGAAQREAATSVLHGAAGALPADRAAFALLPGAGLEAEREGDTLVVRVAP